MILRNLAPLLLLAAYCLHAQSSQAVIEAVVTKSSAFAKDLTAESFKLTIAGKEQTVVSVGPRNTPHYTILLFDVGTISPERIAEIRSDLTTYLPSAAGPNRYVAIMKWLVGLEIVQRFTSDPTAAAKSLETVAGALSGENAAPRLGAGPSGGLQMRLQDLAGALAALADSLAPIRGRKDILYFSGGNAFPQENIDVVDAMMASFNRANVAVHGVSSNGGWADTYADGTGGTTIKFSNSMTEALKMVVEEQASYYRLSFTPTGLEAGCHPVKIRMSTGGLDVRSRRIWCTPRSTDPLAGTPAGKELETRAAGSANGSIAATMYAPYFYLDAARARVNVALEISVQRIKFQKRKGKLEADLNIAGAALGEGGSPAARFSDVATFSFEKQDQVDAFQKTSFHYETQFEVPAGKYTVRAAFSAADAFGKVEAPVVVERRDPAQIGVAAITFARPRRGQQGGMAAGLDPALLEGSAPLTIRGIQLAPFGATKLKTTDAAVIYTEVSPPAGAADAPQYQFRFVDRATGNVRFGTDLASAAQFGGSGQTFPVALDAPLQQLGPGKYRVEIRAVSGGANVVKGLDFDVD